MRATTYCSLLSALALALVLDGTSVADASKNTQPQKRTSSRTKTLKQGRSGAGGEGVKRTPRKKLFRWPQKAGKRATSKYGLASVNKRRSRKVKPKYAEFLKLIKRETIKPASEVVVVKLKSKVNKKTGLLATTGLSVYLVGDDGMQEILSGDDLIAETTRSYKSRAESLTGSNVDRPDFSNIIHWAVDQEGGAPDPLAPAVMAEVGGKIGSVVADRLGELGRNIKDVDFGFDGLSLEAVELVRPSMKDRLGHDSAIWSIDELVQSSHIVVRQRRSPVAKARDAVTSRARLRSSPEAKMLRSALRRAGIGDGKPITSAKRRIIRQALRLPKGSLKGLEKHSSTFPFLARTLSTIVSQSLQPEANPGDEYVSLEYANGANASIGSSSRHDVGGETMTRISLDLVTEDYLPTLNLAAVFDKNGRPVASAIAAHGKPAIVEFKSGFHHLASDLRELVE